MQLLNQDMPGLYSLISSASSNNSSVLGYSRHEFSTYYLQHAERASHTVIDGAWHADGTRHVDHDHLILAIAGTLYNGTAPVPGATPSFTLRMERASLFHHGLVATSTSSDAMRLSNNARTDSYNSRTGAVGHAGNVRSNGPLTLTNSAVVDGDATAKAFSVVSPARITGSRTNSSQSESFLPVQRPDFLTDLGEVTLDGSSTRTLTPGSYLVRESLMVQNNALLYVDNCAGPVTVYVSGKITVQDTGQIVTCSIDPELFAVYIDGAEPVELKGAGGTFHGVIYAPQSLVEISNDGILYGSLVAGRLDVSNSAVVHYDANLKGSSDAN